MTKKDTIGLFGILIAAYPNFDKFKDDEQIESMVNMWATMFADDDSTIVGLAVKKHIMTSKWPPSIAEIRELMADITHPDLIPPDQAWTVVSDLLTIYGEHSATNFELVAPPLIASVLKSIGWHTLWQLHRGSYGGNKDGMDRVAFMDLYRPAYERARQAACCSPSLNKAIESTSRQLSAGALAQVERIHQRRLQQEKEWDDLIYNRTQRLIESSERRALEAGDEE